MRLFPLFFLLVSLSSCTLFGGRNTVSKWPVLQEAASVKCHQWPTDPRFLNIQDLRVVGKDRLGFVAKVTQRNGAQTNYYAPFDGSTKISGEDLQLRDFGPGAVIAGGGSIGEQIYAVVLPTVKSPGVMEIRSMEDNVVRYFAKGLEPGARTARSFWSKKGVWLLYRAGNDETSSEDMNAKLAFAAFNQDKSELRLSVYRGIEFPQDAEVIIDKEGRALVAWLVQEKQKGKISLWLKLAEIDGHRQLVNPVKTVGLPLKSELESAKIAAYRDGILAAVVDGDSLVGQAAMRIAYIEWSNGVAALKWVKEAALTNEHVSMPEWAINAESANLLIPKWLDEESTIASYRVGQEGIEKIAPFGVFSKGSRIMTTFVNAENQDIYAVLRARGKYGWQFDICNFGDL